MIKAKKFNGKRITQKVKDQDLNDKILYLKKKFYREESMLYSNIISTLEFDVNPRDNYRLEYNGLPLKIGTRKLVLLTGKNMDYDQSEYTPFRPLKNHSHCEMILDFIQHNDEINAILYVGKEKTKEVNKAGKPIYHYYASLRNGDEILAIAEGYRSEIDVKFKCLYSYLYNYDDNEKEQLDETIKQIYRFDNNIKKKILDIENSIPKKKK